MHRRPGLRGPGKTAAIGRSSEVVPSDLLFLLVKAERSYPGADTATGEFQKPALRAISSQLPPCTAEQAPGCAAWERPRSETHPARSLRNTICTAVRSRGQKARRPEEDGPPAPVPGWRRRPDRPARRPPPDNPSSRTASGPPPRPAPPGPRRNAARLAPQTLACGTHGALPSARATPVVPAAAAEGTAPTFTTSGVSSTKSCCPVTCLGADRPAGPAARQLSAGARAATGGRPGAGDSAAQWAARAGFRPREAASARRPSPARARRRQHRGGAATAWPPTPARPPTPAPTPGPASDPGHDPRHSPAPTAGSGRELVAEEEPAPAAHSPRAPGSGGGAPARCGPRTVRADALLPFISRHGFVCPRGPSRRLRRPPPACPRRRRTLRPSQGPARRRAGPWAGPECARALQLRKS